MPGVYKRRQEYVVAEALPAGGTVSGKNGITPVAQGDMQVGSTYYAASDFAAQFEPVAYEDCPEDLKAVSDPERYEREHVAAEKAAEREARATERRTDRGRRGNDRPTPEDDDSPEIIGKTTKLGESGEETERVPTPEVQSTWGK